MPNIWFKVATICMPSHCLQMSLKVSYFYCKMGSCLGKPKDRDVVEDDGDHLEDFAGLNGRGSVLDEEKFFLSKNSRLPP